MTTGNDYAIRFISIRPDENTRSIVEIEEEVKTNGYVNLNDDEINNYIEYQKHIVKQETKIEQFNANTEAIINNFTNNVNKLIESLGE